ncbi:type II secretion system protein [Vibrio owensii]|uniref:type II secretion system protein n=1 Tax=Vibrio owensii TaxID=696485 RepID=UPI003AB040B9
MKRKSGFTLIELVVVIVILGILAVTAAPRFLNIQDDAREARLEGMKGAIASGLGIGYAKLATTGQEHLAYVSNTNTHGSTPMQALPFDGCELNGPKDCVFLYGYPDSDENSLGLLIQEVENQHASSDWQIKMISNRLAYISARDDKSASETNCSIIYGPPTGPNTPYTLKLNHCS